MFQKLSKKMFGFLTGKSVILPSTGRFDILGRSDHLPVAFTIELTEKLKVGLAVAVDQVYDGKMYTKDNEKFVKWTPTGRQEQYRRAMDSILLKDGDVIRVVDKRENAKIISIQDGSVTVEYFIDGRSEIVPNGFVHPEGSATEEERKSIAEVVMKEQDVGTHADETTFRDFPGFTNVS